MKRTRMFLTATSGFTQALTAGTASAQNSFYDDLCQVSQIDEARCEDFGCANLGGQCIPTQGLAPNGDDIQGCICIGPNRPEQECEVVFDHHTGGQFCVDLWCPPATAYSCDPACRCPGPNEVGDPRCQPSQLDPNQCDDLGCSPSGVCIRTSALFPDGQYHQVCHCEELSQGGPIDGCEVLFDPHNPGFQVCADFDCGNTAIYECNGSVANCGCTCDTAVPPEVSGLRWSSKVRFFWNPTPCATVYSVYRQVGPLTNCGGIACLYGSCLWNGLVAENATDAVVPSTGVVQFYLVTAKSYVAEGTMGSASVGPRPNTSPCPTPPPPPP